MKKRALLKGMVRAAAAFSAAAALFAGTAFTAAADDDDEVEISQVRLNVVSNINRDNLDNIEVTIPDEVHYILDGYEVAEPEGGLSATKYGDLAVYLAAEEGYRFTSSTRLVADGDAYAVTSKKTSQYDMTIHIALKPYGGNVGEPMSPHWVGEGTAVWGPGYGAEIYTVVLKKDNKKNIKSVRTSGTSYNFAPYMQAGSTYIFYVQSRRLVDGKTKKTASVGSGELTYVTEGLVEGEMTGDAYLVRTMADPAAGPMGDAWISDANGVWYERADGTYPTGGWYQLKYEGETSWYYFDSDGYILRDTDTPDGYYVDPMGRYLPGGRPAEEEETETEETAESTQTAEETKAVVIGRE